MPIKKLTKTSSVRTVSSSPHKGPPVAVNTGSRVSQASYMSGPDGTIRIKRTEFAGSCSNDSTTYFTLSSLSSATPGYDLNPANSLLFPWLSGIAVNYERFKFNAVGLRLIPSQATTTPGRVYLAADYDYDDAVPTSKIALMSNRTVAEAPVWQEVRIHLDPKQLHPDMPFKYVSTTSRGNYVEPRTAFCGYVMVAFDSSQANLLFDIEVSYDVTLSVPVYDANLAGDSLPTAGGVDTTMSPTSQVSGMNYYNPATVSGPSPIPTVIPGSGNAPVLPIAGAALAATARLAIDLAKVGRRGNLGSKHRYRAAGLTPVGHVTTNEPKSVLQLFDSLGTYLGTATTDDHLASGVDGGISAKDAGWATVNEALDVALGVSLPSLFTKYPALRYAVPLLLWRGSTAFTANSYRFGTQFTL